MEGSSNEVPQLTVEIENIQRKSSFALEAKPLYVEPTFEGTSGETATILHALPTELHLDIRNESNMKRIDSDSKFGHMETIPLELSGQDHVSDSGEIKNNMFPEGDSKKSESLPLQMRSLSLNEGNLLPKTEAPAFLQRTHSAADSGGMGENSLSKYFNLNVSKSDPVDSKGVEFFNALSSDTMLELSSEEKSINFVPIPIDEEARTVGDVGTQEKKAEIAEEVLEDPTLISGDGNSTNKEKELHETPTLLKFFAEEKSGTDTDGKAFFDKIAKDKIHTPSVLSAQKPISSATSPQSPYQISPILDGEIEEAWIPSELTRQTLVKMVTSAPGTFTPDKNQLTMPGVIIDEELGDPVKALLIESYSTHGPHRKVLAAGDVSQDEEGLKKLIESECYHAAINLTKQLLKDFGQGPGGDGHQTRHSPLSLRIWYTRLALLVKLKKFSLAEVESAAFNDLDKPDMYYEFYPDIYNGKKGTMVPFSFRLLLAELPQYQGNHQIALDNLYHILNILQKIIINLQTDRAEDGSMIELLDSRRKASLELWGQREIRVLYSVLNCVLSLKDYVLAVSVVNVLLEKDKDHAPQLHSALGRIYLQLGDVKYAQEYFTKAATLSQAMSGDINAQVDEKIKKALLAIAHNNNEEAYRYYQQAYALCPDNPMLANNMAVCLLYMGRLKESLLLLEKTILSKPSSCLHDGILFNTCTLYELESSRCTQKKLSMLDLVSKHAGDGFNVSCLKIQPASKG